MSDDSIKIGDYTSGYKWAPLNPKYAGGYQLGGLKIMIESKPMWLHRKMMKWCFNWDWIDN